MNQSNSLSVEGLVLAPDHILVKPMEVAEELTDGGLYKPPTTTKYLPNISSIIKTSEDSKFKEGTVVVTGLHGGNVLELKGITYRLLEEKDIKGYFE